METEITRNSHDIKINNAVLLLKYYQKVDVKNVLRGK